MFKHIQTPKNGNATRDDSCPPSRSETSFGPGEVGRSNPGSSKSLFRGQQVTISRESDIKPVDQDDALSGLGP
jgi:hypothetical protein